MKEKKGTLEERLGHLVFIKSKGFKKLTYNALTESLHISAIEERIVSCLKFDKVSKAESERVYVR